MNKLKSKKNFWISVKCLIKQRKINGEKYLGSQKRIIRAVAKNTKNDFFFKSQLAFPANKETDVVIFQKHIISLLRNKPN